METCGNVHHCADRVDVLMGFALLYCAYAGSAAAADRRRFRLLLRFAMRRYVLHASGVSDVLGAGS